MPIKRIAALADTAEAQGFVLSPGVKLASPEELEGKKTAFTQGSPSPLLLAKNVIDVPLPHARDRFGPDFVAMERDIKQLVRVEVQKLGVM